MESKECSEVRVVGRCILLILLFSCTLFADYGDTIKVLTYNLYAGGHTNAPYHDIVEVLNDIDADVVGHQEVDSCNGRNELDVIAWLGEQVDMYSHFAPGLKSWNGGSYGIGMLAREEPLNIRRFWISLSSYGAEDRGASEVEIMMNGETVRVLNTHVAYTGAPAPTVQAQKMVEWIDEGGDRDIPMIIMGDFNARPNGSVMNEFEDAGFTFVRNPDGSIMDAIDHIMFRPAERWTLIDRGKPTHYSASDHDPVWAILKLNPTTAITAGENLLSSKTVQLQSVKGRKIQLTLAETALVSVELFTVSGRKIASLIKNRRLQEGTQFLELNHLHLNSGLYICKVTLNGKESVQKLQLH